MNPIVKIFKFGGIATLFAMAASAHAAPCATTDMTYGKDYPLPPIFTANQCKNDASGNDTATTINALPWNVSYGTGSFVQGDKSDSAGAGSNVSLFGGLWSFTLTATAGTSGTYSLVATDLSAGAPNFPQLFDFVFAIKSGSVEYAAYLFDNVVVDGVGGGQWAVTFNNSGNNIGALSHLSVYVREGSSDTTSQTTSLTVIEPGSTSLALIGLGLLGVGFVRRRKALG